MKRFTLAFYEAVAVFAIWRFAGAIDWIAGFMGAFAGVCAWMEYR